MPGPEFLAILPVIGATAAEAAPVAAAAGETAAGLTAATGAAVGTAAAGIGETAAGLTAATGTVAGAAAPAAAAAAGGGTLGTLGLIGTGAGVLTSALGALTAGRAQSQAAAYQAQVARNNAIVAQQNAALAAQQGQAQIALQQQKTRQTVGAVLAGEAGAGLEVGRGSAAELTAGVTEAGQLSAMTEAQKAALGVYGYRAQATSYGAEAGLQELKAAQAQTAGTIGTAGTLIGGAGQVASKWAELQAKGASPVF